MCIIEQRWNVQRAESRVKGFLLPFLFFVTGVSFFGIIAMTPLSETIKDILFPRVPVGLFDPRLDPSLHVKVPFLGRGNLDKSKPKLIIYAGPCTQCSVARIKFSSINAEKYSEIAVVFSMPRAEIKQADLKVTSPFVIFSDPSLKIKRELNAAYSPRYYLVSAHNQLLKIQKRQGQDPNFVWKKE